MPFHPNQRVVCVNASGSDDLLTEGDFYTVAEVFPDDTLSGRAVITVAEVEARVAPMWCRFWAARFLPAPTSPSSARC